MHKASIVETSAIQTGQSIAPAEPDRMPKLEIVECFGTQLEISIHDDLHGMEAEWTELERNSDISIYQSYDWINTCINTVKKELNAQTMIVCARQNGRLVFVLPLAVQNGLVRKLRWIGGNHSNFNMALVDREFGKKLNPENIKLLFGQIAKMLPGIGYLKLCCQPTQWKNAPNFLLAMPHQTSINGAFGMDLSKGFKHLLAQGNGKRKRKKFRSQTRAVELLGGAELVEAKTAGDVADMLREFHLQKAGRLQNQGMRDVFGSPDTQLFLERMALRSLDNEGPTLRLYGLKIGDRYRAICGGGILGQHFSAYFISFADDDVAHISPGEMLLYMLVETLADKGFQSMDLGCGDERYKRSWCPEQIEMFDVIHPISVFAYGHVWAHKALLGTKRAIRQNPRAWQLYKRLRTKAARFLPRH